MSARFSKGKRVVRIITVNGVSRTASTGWMVHSVIRKGTAARIVDACGRVSGSVYDVHTGAEIEPPLAFVANSEIILEDGQ